MTKEITIYQKEMTEDCKKIIEIKDKNSLIRHFRLFYACIFLTVFCIFGHKERVISNKKSKIQEKEVEEMIQRPYYMYK